MPKSGAQPRHHSRHSRRTTLPPELRTVNLNAAGVDVGADRQFVAVPEGRDPDGHTVRSFGAFTADLHALTTWLRVCDVETVAMESTGVYWIPLFELLAEQGFDVKLVDPRQMKHVPGRKSDVLDCQWIQQLHTYGLLAGAFRPTDEICVLRSYFRQRAMLVRYASHHIQHVQKALEQMNVKLTEVVSDVTGLTGMAIIRAILNGERDPQVLAKLRDRRCQNSEETIARALQGNWRDEHLFELRQAVALVAFYHEQIAACDRAIEGYLARFNDKSAGQTLPPSRPRKTRSTHLAFDGRNALHRVTGVDLTRIDGIEAQTALTIVAEVGLDMTRWPSEKHFASWLGLAPGTRVSGGKKLSGRTKPSTSRAAAALRMAASSLHHSQSALGAFFRRMKARVGPPKAITATARKLACLIYRILRFGTQYVDRGQDYYERRYQGHLISHLTRRAKQLGYTLVKAESPSPASVGV
jgi:transposase